MNLILTFDYELFGDGSGDVFGHMIEPTEQIFKICDEYGIKMTLFFEVIEYIKLKEEWEDGNRMGYQKNPVKAIEDQVQQAALDGHDIQLHIHPQWVNAKYKNEKWEIDYSNWRLGDFAIEKDYDIEDLLRDGKSTLENIIQQVKPGYNCAALRAGGYNIMPSQKIFKAMQKLGLELDSSVYPGGYECGYLSKYDYRDVPIAKDYWWADSQNMTQEARSNQKILEIPIFSLKQPRWKKLLRLEKIKSLLKNRKNAVSSSAREKITTQSNWEKIKFLFGEESFTWDFCLFNRSMHKKYFKYIETNLQRESFVLIGHPKSFTTPRSLSSLIKLAQNSNRFYSFKTLKEVYEKFNN